MVMGAPLLRRHLIHAPVSFWSNPASLCREETSTSELLPRLLYLVHPDGTRKLVRGAIFDELDNRSLRSDIVAVGNDPYVSNSLGAVPQTTIAPSMLFDDIGVKRATLEQQKLPYYAPPALPGK
jgi:TldD protein